MRDAHHERVHGLVTTFVQGVHVTREIHVVGVAIERRNDCLCVQCDDGTDHDMQLIALVRGVAGTLVDPLRTVVARRTRGSP